MRSLMLFLIFSFCINNCFGQICAELTNWTEISDNGDGTCTYEISINVNSGNGASGSVTFSLAGSTVFVQTNCICNPELITFPITVACGTAVEITVEYDAPGKGNDCSGTTGEIILPVEWLSFDVAKNENSNELNWSVKENGNHKYIIERSNNGVDFEKIDELSGIGKNNQIVNYFYKDENPSSGINYYRIKQLDFDDSFSYSEVISIKNFRTLEAAIFPNPFRDLIRIESKQMNSWKLLDVLGRAIMMGTENEIATDHLIPGVYYLQLFDKAENYTLSNLIKI